MDKGRKLVLIIDLPVTNTREETERLREEGATHAIDNGTGRLFCINVNYPTPWNAIQLQQPDMRNRVYELKCIYCLFSIPSCCVPLDDVEELSKAIAFMKQSPAP